MSHELATLFAAGLIYLILLFLVAGMLEGFARQLVTDMGARYAIGGGALALWIAFFARAGRGHGR